MQPLQIAGEDAEMAANQYCDPGNLFNVILKDFFTEMYVYKYLRRKVIAFYLLLALWHFWVI